MNTVSIEIEKDNNIPNFFDENSLNNLSYDNTELIENFYKNPLYVFIGCNRDSISENKNRRNKSTDEYRRKKNQR